MNTPPQGPFYMKCNGIKKDDATCGKSLLTDHKGPCPCCGMEYDPNPVGPSYTDEDVPHWSIQGQVKIVEDGVPTHWSCK